MLKTNKEQKLLEEFYADEVVSHEMDGNVYTGKDAVRAKNEGWYTTFEVLKFEIDGISNVEYDQFIVEFDMKIKNRSTGEEMEAEEYGLYTVKDGKIVEEKFLNKTDI